MDYFASTFKVSKNEYFLKVTSVYVKMLRTILYLCKFIGIINMTYILQSDGLLIQSTDSMNKLLEISRIIMLIILSHFSCKNTDFIHRILIFKVWIVIIASRISEFKVIQLMNGIIEYDLKLTSLPKFLLIRQISPKIIYWNIIFIITLIYYIAITSIIVYLWPPKTIDITTIAVYFIRLEFIIDVSVVFSSYFFLKQLQYRYQILNDTWVQLLPGFIATPGGLTHSITEMTLEKIRLLHSNLSDLLKIFSDGYGKILLGFFIFSYFNMLISFYYYIIVFDTTDIFIQCLPIIFNLQNVILILSIVITASSVHEKKRKMISNLRLIRISNLSANLKIQVKLFMNQITVLESSEITAFGIFSINLNLVVSILVLVITGLITIIQMKKYPTMLVPAQNFKNFIQNTSNTKNHKLKI